MTATSTTEREFTVGQIEMLNDAIEGNPEPIAEVVELRDRLVAKLAAMGDAQGAVQTITAEARPWESRPDAGAKAANQYGTTQVKYATEKQVAFLASLLRRKDLSGARINVAALQAKVDSGKVSKVAASDALDVLIPLPDKAAPAGGVVVRPASDKQVALVKRLAAERDWKRVGDEAPQFQTVCKVIAGEVVEGRAASAAIDMLFAADKVQVTPAAALESGIYRTAGGSIYKVYLNQNRDRLLAKLLVLPAADAGLEQAKGEWDYKGMAARFVTADQKMTLEQAKEFGRIYGVCCACGAMLTDEVSIENGIGPVCGRRF